MEKYRLTAEEVLVIDLLFLASVEENHREYFMRYFNLPVTKVDLRTILLSLQGKEVIKKSYKVPGPGKEFDPEAVDFNQNFLNTYRKFSNDLGAEMLQAYPHFINIKGFDYDISNYAKKFHTEEEFYFAYGKAIGWKLEKHKEVMTLIEWAKKNTNYLNFNICDFVISKAWNRILELKNGDHKSLRFDNTIIA